MKNAKFPLQKKYWAYVILCLVLGILLFVNIFVLFEKTGGRELCNFTQQDWICFVLFLLTQALLIAWMAFFAIKGGKLLNKRDEQVEQYFDQFKYAGITPGDYDYVWFDFSSEERAKIAKSGDAFFLYVESFDEKTESWNAVNTVSVFSTLAEIKKSLYYDFDFFCEENTVFDQHGDEIFKDSH